MLLSFWSIQVLERFVLSRPMYSFFRARALSPGAAYGIFIVATLLVFKWAPFFRAQLHAYVDAIADFALFPVLLLNFWTPICK